MLSVPEFEKKQILIVFTREGEKLSFSNDNIIIRTAEGEIRHKSTCYKLFLLIIVGDTSITTGLIKRSRKFGFSICLMTETMKVYQTLHNMGDGNTLLREMQYGYKDDELGKYLIKNKISSQLAALKRLRDRSVDMKNTCRSLAVYRDELMKADNVNEIMGIEGMAAKKYFVHMFDFPSWSGRKPRVKPDYINATLDIGYNILFNYVEAITNSFGFDIYQGILHRCFYMRKSLICDLVEPFRPLIDLKVRKGINLGQIKENDFKKIGGQYVLEWKNSPQYVKLLSEAVIERKEDIFRYIQLYYRAFMKKLQPEEFPEFKM